LAALLGIPPTGGSRSRATAALDLPTGNIGYWQHSHIGTIPPPPASRHPKLIALRRPLPENFFRLSSPAGVAIWYTSFSHVEAIVYRLHLHREHGRKRDTMNGVYTNWLKLEKQGG